MQMKKLRSSMNLVYVLVCREEWTVVTGMIRLLIERVPEGF